MAVSISSITTATNDGTSATVSVTTSESPVTTQVGDLVVVIHGNNFYTLANMPTPTATGSPTLTNIVDADGGTNQGHIRAWYYYANTGGAQTVSVTESGAHDEEKDMAVFVLTGAASSSPIDGAASGFSTTDAQPVCPSISPANTDSYLIAPVQSGGAAGPGSYTPPGSLTEKYDVIVGQLEAAAGIAQLTVSGATGTFTWTNAVNRPYASATFAIKTAPTSTSVSGPPPPTLPPWLLYELILRAQQQYLGGPPTAGPESTSFPLPTTPRFNRPNFRPRVQRRPVPPTQESPPLARAAPLRVRPRLRPAESVVVPTQAAAPVVSWIPQPVEKFLRFATRRRARPNLIVPQLPMVWQARHVGTRPVGRTRRRATETVPAQVVVTPPSWTPQPVRQRLRAARLSLRRIVAPVPDQVILTAPTWTPQPVKQRLRAARAVRRRVATPVPEQLAPAPSSWRTRIKARVLSRLRRTPAPAPVQALPPSTTRSKPRAVRIVRVRARAFIPAQIILIAPAYVPQQAGKRQAMAAGKRRRRTDGWLAVSVVNCQLPRPGTGTTLRPTGITLRPSGSTTRPGSGLTNRASSGNTDNPC